MVDPWLGSMSAVSLSPAAPSAGVVLAVLTNNIIETLSLCLA